MFTVYHLDDDCILRLMLRKNFSQQENFLYRDFAGSQDLLEAFASNPPDLILLDVHLDTETLTGLDVFKKIRKIVPDQKVCFLSSTKQKDLLLRCALAEDVGFLSKDARDGKPWERIKEVCEEARTSMNDRPSSTHQVSPLDLPDWVSGATMQRVARQLKGVIPSFVKSVHVFGETGTGKEVVGQILKYLLAHETPFVTVNCAAIAESLQESEFFGHRKGSFSGALKDRKGFFEQADGGWIFLDEVACLKPSTQAALLRVLETGEIRPLGAEKPLRLNVRILSATNENLEKAVQKGTFRGDLLQRLSGYRIDLPPLRKRKEEIEAICGSLLKKIESKSVSANKNSENEESTIRISSPVLELFRGYDWASGNVRELYQVILASCAHLKNNEMTLQSLPAHFLEKLSGSLEKNGRVETLQPLQTYESVQNDLVHWIECKLAGGFTQLHITDWEDELLMQALSVLHSKGMLSGESKRQVAEKLKISRYLLVTRMKKIMNRSDLSAHLKSWYLESK
jgi:DNA-binding NtrC family response regulator